MKCSTAALPLLLALQMPFAMAQSVCNSDGAPAPQALYERFLSADCASCWSESAFVPGASAAVLDWIAPGRAGDDAPLSAAARTDALTRLESIGRPVPATTDLHIAAVAERLPGHLRIGFGPAMSDYVGTSVSYLGALHTNAAGGAGNPGEWSVWLALVEQIPAGVEGTQVPRNLVRNLLQLNWSKREQLSKKETARLPKNTRWIERRPMQLPTGTDPERLALIGWMQNAQGEVVATARADCAARKP